MKECPLITSNSGSISQSDSICYNFTLERNTDGNIINALSVFSSHFKNQQISQNKNNLPLQHTDCPAGPNRTWWENVKSLIWLSWLSYFLETKENLHFQYEDRKKQLPHFAKGERDWLLEQKIKDHKKCRRSKNLPTSVDEVALFIYFNREYIELTWTIKSQHEEINISFVLYSSVALCVFYRGTIIYYNYRS